MLMLSGPVELLFLDCVIAFFVCVVLKSIGVVWSLRVCLSILLLSGSVLCFMTFVNCLLNCDVFCLLVIAVVLLKVMVVFGLDLDFVW